MELNATRKKVRRIGKKLINCPLKCEGVVNEPKKGIVPRGLMLDNPRDTRIGCIVVGINQGYSSSEEMRFYSDKCSNKSNMTYELLEEGFKKFVRNKPYFKKTRNFIKEVGFEGNILWTDLCKCENEKKGKPPPNHTFGVCIKKFLKRELEISPDAPIVAVGNRVFEFIALSYPERFVVGIPHPTASYGHFKRLCEGNALEQYRRKIAETRDNNRNGTSVKIHPLASK
jgi:hypothetical protein